MAVSGAWCVRGILAIAMYMERGGQVNQERRSLRHLVEKWSGPYVLGRVRLTRVGRSVPLRCRCVRVDFACASRPMSILFFRHEDGFWYLFPSAGSRFR